MTSDQPSGLGIRRLSENLVYRNKFAAVYDDPVEFPDGSKGTYLRVVESDGQPGVAMLALCGDQVALVRTYRYAISEWEWAIPRGFAHGSGVEQSATAELAEELGEVPDELTSIGTVTPNSGLLASRVEVFLARYSTPAKKPLDRMEVAEVRWISSAALFDEIADGKIKDAFTLATLSLARARGVL